MRATSPLRHGSQQGSLSAGEARGNAAEVGAFKELLRGRHRRGTVYAYAAGARELLLFLERQGTALGAATAALFRAFRDELEGRAQRGELKRSRVEVLLNGARSFLREKARAGAVQDEDLFALMAPGDFDARRPAYLAGHPERAALLREVDDFERRYRALGYHTSYRVGVLAFLLFLERRGRALRQLRPEDWSAFRGFVQGSEHLLQAAGAYLRLKAGEGRLRADQVPRALSARRGPVVELAAGLRGVPRLLEEAMSASDLSATTRPGYARAVRDFLLWLERAGGLVSLNQVTRDVLTAYRLHLQTTSSRRGRPYAVNTQLGALVALRFLFGWLLRTGRLLSDPTAHLPSPRAPQKLPRTLKVAEVARLLRSLPSSTPLGLRDRALVELLYGTGLRRAEAARLSLDDVDLEQHTLLVREGKGRKDRLLPLGRKAQQALVEYVERGRVQLFRGNESRALFVGLGGRPLRPGSIGERLHRLGARVGLELRPHMLRHSCATHLLKGRADIRHIQRLLGHKSLQTTERYTRVEVADLRAVIQRCHPRERRGGP